jgi:hypothetical protein
MGCGCKMRGGRRSSQRRRSSTKKQRGGMIRDLTRVIPWSYNNTPANPSGPEWQPKPPAGGFEIGTRGGSRRRRSSTKRRSSHRRRY